MSKKLKIFETHNSLSITLRWFSPIAIFLVFFTTFWCAFLVFWYSMASAGAPLIFMLAPLIHVAVGGFLIYYTACLFLNRTYIDVDDQFLTVSHRPIPWWRGNQQLPSKDIQQLYVQEKISRNKNGATYNYHLRAKLTDGSDLPVVAVDNIEAPEMQEIENRLEGFLGIIDYPVKGEYGTKNPFPYHDKKSSATPEYNIPKRQQKRALASSFSFLYQSEKKDIIEYKKEDLDLLSITQYDWKDGNSDKLFQLVNKVDKETLLYFKQNKALLNVFEEREMSYSERLRFHFSADNAPASLHVSNRHILTLNHPKSGQAYFQGIYPSIKINQWMYFSADKSEYIRVGEKDGLISFSKGTEVKITDFKQGLDLNDLPFERAKIEQSYDDEDFV